MSIYVPAVAPLSRRDIEAEAEAIIRRYYPHLLREPGPFPVLDFFDHILPEAYCLDTGVEDLSDGVEGMTWPDGRVLVSPGTYLGASHVEGRPRFTVPHECFHGIKHHKQIRRVLVDSGRLVLHRRITIRPFVDPEWQADTFSSAILMPAPMVNELARKVIRPYLPSVMVSVFQVSEAAARVRVSKLGL